MILMPNSGTSTVDTAAMSWSRIWIWSTRVRLRRARIFISCTWAATRTMSAMDALEYAVDQRIAPIISSSYGQCETGLSEPAITRA